MTLLLVFKQNPDRTRHDRNLAKSVKYAHVHGNHDYNCTRKAAGCELGGQRWTRHFHFWHGCVE